MRIRVERPEDANTISHVSEAAFLEAEHTSGTEARIVEALRAADVLSVSLVAEDEGEIVGHIAFSPVTVSDGSTDWYGLGPVSVLPSRQRQALSRIETADKRFRSLDRTCRPRRYPNRASSSELAM